MNTVTIIIPCYNTHTSATALIAQLGKNFPIIVINNSTKHFKHPKQANLTTINMGFNSGFAHACNVGAQHAQTEWLLFLNSDVKIDARVITQLIEFTQTEKLDCVSPVLVDEQGKKAENYHQPLPTFLNLVWQFSPLRRIKNPFINSQTTLPGACLLIKRSVFERLEGWDERFFVWWEDSDLSKRLYQGGYAAAVAKNIKVVHIGGETFKPLSATYKRELFFHSLELFCRKHFSSIAQKIIQLLTARFYKQKLYSADTNLVASVVVPNMKKNILESFLTTNIKTLDFSKHELLIVTSATNIEQLRKDYPEVIFIVLMENKGFADTVNIGVRRARGIHIATVNDDTILFDNWLTKLLEPLHDSVGSVSPHVVDANGRSESLGIYILPAGKAVALHPGNSRHKPNAFNAAAVLLNRKALEKTGLFNEWFGSYLEDLDLGLRMARNGFTHHLAPEIKVVHLGQQTSKEFPLRKSWQDLKNWWLLIFSNYTAHDYVQHAPSILLERGRNLSGLLKSLLQKH